MDEFERIILSYKDFNFSVIEPGGNHGDVMIYKGTEKMLKKSGVKYKVYKYKELDDLVIRFFWLIMKIIEVIMPKMGISRNRYKIIINKIDFLRTSYCVSRGKIHFNKNEVILIQGGGDFHDIYGLFGIRLLKMIINCCPENTLIIAPQSYYFETAIFPQLFCNYKGEAHLFCREKFSYKLLQSMDFPRNIKIILSPGTSFYFIEEILPFYKNVQANHLLYNLLAFREDPESIINGETKKLIKTKIIGAERTLVSDISLKAKNMSEFLNLIAYSKRVYTDRLHVGIVATLLGKQVFLFPCGYWKTKGVYLYRLEKYKNVTYVDKCYLGNKDKLVSFILKRLHSVKT